MTKYQAWCAFRDEILAEVRQLYEPDGLVDEPARAEAWTAYVDDLREQGLITQRQSATWTRPPTYRRTTR